jgi:hypothetical protein
MTKVHYGTQIPPLFLESAGPLYQILVSLPPETVNFSVLICFDEGWIRIKYVEFFFWNRNSYPISQIIFFQFEEKNGGGGIQTRFPKLVRYSLLKVDYSTN